MTASETVIEHHRGDALDILSSYRRRLVLARASERANGVSLSMLARELAAAAHDQPLTAVTSEQRERNEIRLHHVDLPPLTAAGLVSYNQQRGVVRALDLPLEGEEWLEMPVVEALETWNS